jgi:hypothetical protein
VDPLVSDANRRFDFAKALLARAEKAISDVERKSLSEAAITAAFSCLEGMLSHVFEHFSGSADFDIYEQSIMNEKAVRIVKGRPSLAEQRFQSIEDRLQYLFWKFSGEDFDASKDWWPGFSEAVRVRNRIMHPKDGHEIQVADAQRALLSLISAINDLMKTVFKKPWPKAKRGLTPSTTI